MRPPARPARPAPPSRALAPWHPGRVGVHARHAARRAALVAAPLHRLLAVSPRTLLAGPLAALAIAAAAQQAPPAPSGLPPEQAEQLLRSERFRHLAGELRCLVCQNQSLADSNADLAVDLRNEVLRQMAAGRDDRQIKEHLVARYGEFVLYRPVVSARNAALWAGPAVLLAIGAAVLWRLGRRRARTDPPATAAADDDARLARVERLLADDDTHR
jgi:cytochrome c-type biogenesis protein CcmH